MNERIAQLRSDLKKLTRPGDYQPIIPHVIKTLDAMLACNKNDKTDQETLRNLTRGLGRLVTDDFEFSESSVGNDLLRLISEVLSMQEISQ